jgi:hypothetical protein
MWGHGKHKGCRTPPRQGKGAAGPHDYVFNAISFERVQSALTINSKKKFNAGCFERKCFPQQQAQRGAQMVTKDTKLDRLQALVARR